MWLRIFCLLEHANSAPALSGTGAKTFRKVPLLLVAVAATLAIAPFFFAGNASGHDIEFHLSSWMDVAGQWREGDFYPRWAEWANWGFGVPRFIFYPPLSWMLGAALGLILPWKATPGAFIWLALILAGMAMWRLAREWLPEAQATAAAVFFAVNPYNLAMVYYRSDFAEMVGVALLPLLLWGALQMIRCNWRHVPYLAVVFAAIWCNAPEGVIATYSLALMLLIATARQRSLRPLLIGASAMAVGFGLAGILHFACGMGTRLGTDFGSADHEPAAGAQFSVHALERCGVSVIQLEDFGHRRGIDAGDSDSSGVAWPKRRPFGKIWWMLLGLGVAASFFMLPISVSLWRHLPELAFLQFPWRWLGPLSVAFAFFAAAAIAHRHGIGRGNSQQRWCSYSSASRAC